ncbi:hypothetical protein BH09VER1_BH09VER1_40090 [soil metagenome]
MNSPSPAPALDAGRRAPFFVPGLLYALLAMATFYLAGDLLRPALAYAKAEYRPGVAASHEEIERTKALTVMPLKLLVVAAFYTALAVMILYRRGRSLAIIGAIVSLPTVGGTIPGLLFLFWTRRYWPKETVKG